MIVGSVEHSGAVSTRIEQDLAKLRETSDRVVGSVFYGTMLKAMRDSALKGNYGHGGRGEEVFGAQLHGLYAEQLGAARRGGLQDMLYRSLEKQQRAMSEVHTRLAEGDAGLLV